MGQTQDSFDAVGGFKVNGTTVINSDGKLIESASIEIADGDTFNDTNGNEVVEFSITGSATNHIGIVNSATGDNPIIRAEGEANTGLTIDNSEGEEIVIFDSVATSVNEFTISSAATNNAPILAATGDNTNIGITLTPKGSGVITTNGKLSLDLNGGAVSASGLLMGVGTTANPATSATAGDIFAEFRTRSSASTGDNRGLYWRHEFTGAGGGECIRAFSKVSAAVGTARGAHISLDVNTTGSVTGLGVGVDAQILVPDQALGGGTYGVVNSEIFSAGSSSSVAASNIAFFRATASGDATGAATVDTGGHLFSIQGLSVGSGKLFQANTAADATHALRIDIGGVDYFIMLTNSGA